MYLSETHSILYTFNRRRQKQGDTANNTQGVTGCRGIWHQNISNEYNERKNNQEDTSDCYCI